MVKSKVIRITSCKQCPYNNVVNYKPYCSMVKRELPNSRIFLKALKDKKEIFVGTGVIPDWCRLPS